MKLAYKKEIEKRLKDSGFSLTHQESWTHSNDRMIALRDGEFELYFTLRPDGRSLNDILLEAEIFINDENSWLLSKKEMELTNEVIEKHGYTWIDEIIQRLYKDAYDILSAKTKIAAEAAITGIESIA